MSNDKHEREEQAIADEPGAASADQANEQRGVQDASDTAAETSSEAEPTGESTEGETSQLTPEEQLQARIAELEAKNAELTDSLLRKSADFDNYRKRMLREKEEFVSYANRELLLDIVNIIDDFERAIRSADESHDFTAFHDGIVMIEKQFTSMLERKWKLTRFDSVGEEFDPQRHEAMMTEDRPDNEQSIVLEDFQKGYLLHDKVLRPAKVKVSMPVSAPSEAQ